MKKILLTLFIFLLTVPAFADIDAKINTPKNQEILKKVETAYNKLHTLKAKFAQFNSESKNDLQTGEIYIDRPGKMRLVYEQGSPLEFYAVNDYFIYHDKDLKEVNYFLLDQTPVNIILKYPLQFNDPAFLVTNVKEVLDEYFVTVIKKEAKELGSLTLIIDKATLQLKQWDVLDIKGITSTVSLYDIKQNVPIDNRLFYFKNPYKKK